MSNYQIMVAQKSVVDAYDEAITQHLETHKFYDVREPQLYKQNGRTLISQCSVEVNGIRFCLTYPHNHGFVVTRDYSVPDEPDPVLKQWGNYEDVEMFNHRDGALLTWFENRIVTLMQRGHRNDFKLSIRIRSFSPRRSKRFVPKITLYQNAQDRFDRDREVAMKPSRAFQMMCPELDHKQLIQITDEYMDTFVKRDLFLKEGEDAKDFVKAYSWEQAPTDNIQTTYSRKSSASSCMRYSFDNLSTHPVTAYASGDFKMLWTEDQDGKIASRCVVRVMDNGEYWGAPIYGVSEQAIDMIADRIHSTGGQYGKDGAWETAKLVRQPVDGDPGEGYFAPYLDLEPRRVFDDGKHLIIDCGGDIDASSYQGILGGYGCCCARCGEGVHEDDRYYSEYNDESYCNDCYWEDHIYCEWADRDCHINETTIVYIPNRYGSNGYEKERVYEGYVEYGDEFIYCEPDGNYWHTDLCFYCEDEDVYVGKEGLDDGTYFISDGNGECYSSDQIATTDNGDCISIAEAEEEGLVEDPDDNVWKKKEEND